MNQKNEITQPMTPVTSRTTRLAVLKAKREQVMTALGESQAKGLGAFGDGTLYSQSIGRSITAWLIDAVVIVGVAIAIALSYYHGHRYDQGAIGTMIFILISGTLVVPFVYGWFYSNGRAIGGLVTGTRLVRAKDGSKIGLLGAGWALFIRFWIGFDFIFGALNGSDVFENPARVSIDSKATQQLREAGFAKISD
jgi:hypothetical protein